MNLSVNFLHFLTKFKCKTEAMSAKVRFFFFFFGITGVWTQASHLLGRCSTTSDTLPALNSEIKKTKQNMKLCWEGEVGENSEYVLGPRSDCLNSSLSLPLIINVILSELFLANPQFQKETIVPISQDCWKREIMHLVSK
jgi:hypothetical protein